MIKKNVLFLFIIFCFVLTSDALSQTLAPDFELQDLYGNIVKLSDYRGKNVLLYFWAIYCPSCRNYLDKLNELYPKWQADKITFLSINIYESKQRNIDFAKKNPINYPVLLDNNSQVAISFDIVGIPTFVAVNKEGEIIYRRNYLPSDLKDLFQNNKNQKNAI
ncbi:MAG: TlpA disulfide reductase family protein [Candidatus Omnitrophota bacterium]